MTVRTLQPRPAPDAQPGLSAGARQVVANPEQYADRPLLRRLAWAALMGGRGRRVDQQRLSRMPVEIRGGRDA